MQKLQWTYFPLRRWLRVGNSGRTLGGWWSHVIDLTPKILPSAQRFPFFSPQMHAGVPFLPREPNLHWLFLLFPCFCFWTADLTTRIFLPVRAKNMRSPAEKISDNNASRFFFFSNLFGYIWITLTRNTTPSFLSTVAVPRVCIAFYHGNLLSIYSLSPKTAIGREYIRVFAIVEKVYCLFQKHLLD